MNKYVDNEPNDVYHAKHDYIGRSELVTTWQKSYAHTLVPTKKTPELIMGGAIHEKLYALLTDDKDHFDNLYCIGKNSAYKTGEKAAFLKENKDKTFLSFNDYTVVLSVAKAILKNPIAANLLDGAILERSFYAEIDGVKMRARPDAMRIDDGILIDFKSAADGSYHGFKKELASRMLDIQAAHYSIVCEEILQQPFNEFVFIVGEKKAPYEVAIYRLDSESLSFSRQLHKRMVQKYVRQKNEQHNGYPIEIQTVDLPQWRLGEEL
jgi:hypothetical protein